ncbi:uncharacterized protein PGTG_04616 [Puccinia graminis f. sp. tritici CRL 75-36-700-3]|uniref:Uncharacterized protein n=1 Tax=Puccinia graminis f. sp. tritici (strain CRL 75-36-700-3 / race SCCL) TaxID=418459 RepID=E3K2U1_PUCGT|nr:uncharacterized protein PGTG_04616 [Puccinia graminis f. sp. tritici CRL 75-36-700-3]EFP78660.2 hypothetical protein PGTG_04616 [Puccinia graminis f. sp. tritici CRL 75-36-700-3]
MSTLERLDLYEKVQALAAHPALKPNEWGHIQALLNDIKADYENSDDEDNTGGPEVTNIQRSPATPVGEERPQTAVHSFNLPAAKSPAGPTGSESYLAPEPQAAKDNRTPNQSPSRAPRIGEFFILPNPIGAPRTTCPTFSQFLSGNTTTAFTSLHKGPHMTLSNANALLELGSSVLKQKIALGITTPMPHSTLDNLRIHFLNFLIKMGFNQLDNNGVPQVNWKDVHASFYNEFSPSVIAGIFSQDIEIALAHRLV